MTSKSIPASTVAVIDPESGTSSGGSGGDTRLAAGDIIQFQFNYFAVPSGIVRGIQGWVTEYVPANTQVIGVRIIDENGLTVAPRYPGLAVDGCGGGCDGYASLPFMGGTRDVDDGTIAQVYADTGVFYTNDSRLTRNPDTSFITLNAGQSMVGQEPIRLNDVITLIGDPVVPFIHNDWDWIQIQSYGISNPNGNYSGNSGRGNTPFRYGSPVAGPETFYRYEATEVSAGVVEFNDVVGPWNRVVYPGSLIGRGCAEDDAGTCTEPGTATLGRMIADASSTGFDVRPANPLPADTVAVRLALGEQRVGEPGMAEVTLLVLDTPLDPVQGDDVDCVESFGGDTSGKSLTVRARDNPWNSHLASPSCVFLKLKFDLAVDESLALGGDTLTYSVTGKNLAVFTQTNTVIKIKYDSSRQSFISATGGGVEVADCDGDGLACIVWPTIDLASSEEFDYTVLLGVGGGGQVTNVVLGNFASDDIPSYDTQAITIVRPIGVIDATVVPDYDSTAAFATAGAAMTVVGAVSNNGTGGFTGNDVRFVLPSGWTMGGTMAWTCPGMGTTNLPCDSDCGTNMPNYRIATAIDASEVCTYSVDINVPGGTADGLYAIDLQVWAQQTSFGGLYESYFPQEGVVNVGARRSAIPAVDCPALSSATVITGTTSEADGTVAHVLLNGVERGTPDASAAGAWGVGTFGGGTTFGRLYGGLEIRATAQAPGELMSELSAACFVTHVPICSDGIDNDGDGLADFPADPGCSSPSDPSEEDVACSDGIDNDGDGDVDYPDDLECTSPTDATEAGPPACNDGIDNDGDGVMDFPADSDCSSSTDRTERATEVCDDNVDNDGDGRADFTVDPGCHSLYDTDEEDFEYPLNDIRARMLFVFDTSGSMNWNTCSDDFVGGDGSVECPGSDFVCPGGGCTPSGCGDTLPNDSRIAKAKSGLSEVIAGFGEVEYSLMRFHQRAADFTCPGVNASARSGGWQGAGSAPCGGGFNAGDLLVGFSPDNETDMLAWMDGESGNGATPPAGWDRELRGTGTTPLAGSLGSALTYLDGVRAGDTAATCRPYRVILLTDGVETCGGDPVGAAATLRAAGFLVNVIGFAVSDAGAVASLNAIANAGGTGTAIFVSDETALAAEMSDIIAGTLLVETCNGLDDDCDTLIDEGFTKFCDVPGGTTSVSLCADPGERVCDGVDDNCDGEIDEGLLNLCGECGPVPAEACNGIDDDCDGPIDEGACMCPVIEPESCDNSDNDCDGFIDEGITRPCGSGVGECTPGTETCAAGVFSMCTGAGPTTETCDGLDNDCDGVIDGIARPCGISTGACEPGTELCTGGTFGTCVGDIGPSPEVCDNIDNDCDGNIDDGNPGGGGVCGSSLGVCMPGTFLCSAGTFVCIGGTLPGAESCNMLDDDCDGAVDEEVPTDGPCGSDVGECNPGARTCISGTFMCIGATGPRSEICDGVDNNCDGGIDEGDPGGGAVCGTDAGVCAPGTTECIGGALECTGGAGASPELCNTLDDDCDGLIDEANPEGGGSCGTTDVGECGFGSEVCVGGSLDCVGETGPAVEICDGLDNDCDGMTDEGDPEGGDACGDDTGECMPGTNRCIGGSLVCDGAVGPTPEICDGLDNDCDGVVDDGIDVGAPCGSDVGECSPGVNICTGGAVSCEGAIGPIDELCDALDNDCDGVTDEGLPLGGSCGMMEGVCTPGMLMCVDGVDVCVGAVPSGPETCDCSDNDCDGAVDEDPDTGAICPPGSACVDCQCALPCSDSEFGTCPTGRVEVDIDGDCFCVAPRCNPETCAEDSFERDGEVLCEPDVDGVPVCVCKNNECTFPCEGVVCADPTVCNPTDGTCVTDDCRGLGCPTDEVCDLVLLECSVDPCVDAGCGVDEVCRDGICETSCADVSCMAGEDCHGGVCTVNLCVGVRCPSTERCESDTGDCVANACFDISCPAGTLCDPLSGACAEHPCARVTCPGDQLCIGGECEEPMSVPDAGVPDGGVVVDSGRPPVDSGGTTPDRETRILGAGGGGCTCRIAAPEPAGEGGPVALTLLVLGGLIIRRRSL